MRDVGKTIAIVRRAFYGVRSQISNIKRSRFISVPVSSLVVLHNLADGTVVTLNTFPHPPLSTYSIFFNVLSSEYHHNRGEYTSEYRSGRRYYIHLDSTFTSLTVPHYYFYSLDELNPPRSAPNQASQDESGFVDSSGPIFSMYLEMAEEEDKKLAESWQADADGILIFVRLPPSDSVLHTRSSCSSCTIRRPVYSLLSLHR